MITYFVLFFVGMGYMFRCLTSPLLLWCVKLCKLRNELLGSRLRDYLYSNIFSESKCLWVKSKILVNTLSSSGEKLIVYLSVFWPFFLQSIDFFNSFFHCNILNLYLISCKYLILTNLRKWESSLFLPKCNSKDFVFLFVHCHLMC